MAADDCDVVVIGAGPAGEVAAGRLAGAGLSTVIVEQRLVGGECSYYGCIPSKTLIRPGDVLAAARRVPGAAEAVTGRIDTAAAFGRRDYMTSDWHDDGQVPWLTDRGVELVRGTGVLTGKRTVEVRAAGAAPRTLRAAKAVVLATGTTPLIPPIPGLRDVGPWDNQTATSAKDVPKRLLVLGGGPVGAELAQAFRRLGSSVVIVEAADRLLAREEPFAADEVQAAFEAEGISVVTGARLTEARRDGRDGRVIATLDNGRAFSADEILVAVGRRPSTSGIGLDTVGLAPGSPVRVDSQLRAVGVTGGWLYAVGDCNGVSPFTHMGKYQARIAADVIAGKQAADVASTAIVPRVTFTDPQVCAVGLTEAAARRTGLAVTVVRTATGDVPGAYVRGTGITGTSQLVIEDSTRRIVGATFTGPDLQELLHSATIAICSEVPVDRLWHAVPSFPTISEVWLSLLEAYGL